MQFDLVLRGGRVIDPAQRLDGTMDVAVADGRIAAVAPSLALNGARGVVDCAGRLVLPGMIDTHGHIYQHVTGRFGLDPDLVGVRSGVTTVVDQGGPSCMTIPGFRHYVAERAATRVLCFISAYLVGGLEGHLYPELYGPYGVNVDATVRSARENADLVRGIKAHAEIGGASRWGLEVIRLGKRIARETGLPLYIHLGQLWPVKDDPAQDREMPDPDRLVEELIPIMEPGDILAHPFTRHPGGFVSAETGEVHPLVWVALECGVLVDVGHGSHFSFAMARKTIGAGIRPTTLGADMHGYNVRVPDAADDRSKNPFFGVAPFNLTNAMAKLLALGLTLPEVVATVTSNAARVLRMEDRIGSLRPGLDADVSVLSLDEGRFVLGDNSGERVIGSQMLSPLFCLRAGRRFEADSPLVPQPLAEAA